MYYLDIETVSAYKNFAEADERTQDLFKTKFFREIQAAMKDSGGSNEDQEASFIYNDKAAVLAEFNKIVCISLGTIIKNEGKDTIYIKSFSGHSETDILIAFGAAIEKTFELCAHFGKGFDYPVLARKYVMHQIPLPRVLQIANLKPWEIPLYDTQEMWKFGDMRHSVSLDLLAHCFGLPSPKENMHGSEVSEYYYNDPEGLPKIVKYCECDVRTLINVHRVMNYLPILS